MEKNDLRQAKQMRNIIFLMFLAFFLYRIDLFYGLMTSFYSIISAFVVGLFMALIINMPLRFLERHLKFFEKFKNLLRLRRGICLTLSVLFVLAFVTILLVVVIPEMIVVLESLIARIPDTLVALEDWLTQYNTNLRQLFGMSETNETSIREFVDRAGGFLAGGLSYSSSFVINVAQVVINSAVGLIFAIYLLYSKERIRGQVAVVLAAYLPSKYSHGLSRVLNLLVDTYSRFLGGQFLQSLISAILIWIFMEIFSFPYAALVALLTFICAFIPIFGPFISGALGGIMVFTTSPGLTGWFLLMYFIVVQLESSLIYPRILSNAVDMPSVWVLVAVTVGGGIMGVAGMLLLIPLFSVFYRLLGENTKRRNKQKKAAASYD